ncbi:MAG: L-threonylcarbamoyladenylate synthase [Pseudomonadota bacterium]
MGEQPTITQAFSSGPEGISGASQLLRAGEIVAFPTETVYGLGGDATNGEAVAKIFDVKGRPSFNPLIVHVASVDKAEALIELPPKGRTLAQMLWPGPLTLVGRLRPGKGLADLVRAGLPTLAVRVPDHPVAQALLRAVGRPLAAPSANPSGKVSPTTAQHVHDLMSGRIAGVLDGGAAAVGLESTIIGFENLEPVLLRPGGVTVEEIAKLVDTAPNPPSSAVVNAPGQLQSHYAPVAEVEMNATEDPVLGFGAIEGQVSLSPDGDLTEAAANLFGMLRLMDEALKDGDVLTVAPIPEEGLGRAINDRLRRAAAPRQTSTK